MNITDERLTAETVAVVLAGGKGTRLGALTRRECKPALPFGASLRTIDFSLSNCVNSGIRHVGVATQYQPESLHRHLLRTWHHAGARRRACVAPWPAACRAPGRGYLGTADAVYCNRDVIARLRPRLVLVLAGDHVYRMDYRPMLAHHLRNGADVTVGCVEVPLDEATQLGVMAIDTATRVKRFVEKPAHPEPLPDRADRALASMGIYVFDPEFLDDVLAADARSPASSHDLGRDVLPALIGRADVRAYPFGNDDPVGRGYWRDVGTLSAYWQAHMDLLEPAPRLALWDERWPIRGPYSAPALLRRWSGGATETRVADALLARGSEVTGARVTRSVVGHGARIEPGAEVRDSVVLPGAVVGRGSRLHGVVVDSECRVPPGTLIGRPGHEARTSGRTRTPILVTAEDFTSEGSGAGCLVNGA